jgi:sugar-specific transcriptional regulator TrmB/DNA-binding CsgD family transcriptional regulator
MLEAAGLSAVEEAVYRSLLRVDPCTTQELSGELRLANQEVEAVVTSLEANGLVSRTDGEPPTFTAVRPDVAVEALLLHREEELQRTRIAVQQLVSEYRATTPERRLEEFVEVAVGRRAIELKFEQLQRGATREVLFCVAPPFVVPLEDNDTELELLEQGIAYRAIYDRSALEMPGAVEQIRRYVLAGEEARALTDVPMKLVVADRSHAIVPARADSATIEAGHVLVHPSTLLDALVTVFEALWAQATPLLVDPSGSLVEVADAPSAEDRIVLSLFLAGLTDIAIADQLGLSVRTVQRRLRRLMDLAGVSTRMQLGWHASRSGWLGWAQSDLEHAAPANPVSA